MEQASFKLDEWEEMVEYAKDASWAIKFDLKKFYHEIDIDESHQKFFGFMFKMEDALEPEYFVWATLPYGYTRAPFIARQRMKPLIAKWRRLGAYVVVFYNDDMAVSKDENFLQRVSLQMQCDLLNAGLVPGVGKCIWKPQQLVDWNGLTFNLADTSLAIMQKRIVKVAEALKICTKNGRTLPKGMWQKLTAKLTL